MSFIRRQYSVFRKNWFAYEAVPLYAILGSAALGTGWYLTYLARRPEGASSCHAHVVHPLTRARSALGAQAEPGAVELGRAAPQHQAVARSRGQGALREPVSCLLVLSS